MIRSGISSPTLTELNSRSAIVEATLSVFLTSPGQRRVGLLYYLAVLVGDHVFGDDDVGAVRLAHRVHVDIAEQMVAGVDRVQELELLVDLDDLAVGEVDVGVIEERPLRRVAEDRCEGQGEASPA
jgi:hypothetical protein